MRSAININLPTPPPPPVHCSFSFPFHLSTHQSKPRIKSPPPSCYSHLYPEELGFKNRKKKKKNHNIPENHTTFIFEAQEQQNGRIPDEFQSQMGDDSCTTEDELMRIQGPPDGVLRRQIMKRSSIIAKQVISIHSALTLGYVSQLWVDTNAWAVLIVQVKPGLLSGDLESFFLDDIAKVGDVLLVEDESVMEHDFKLVGLETLVGYTVITPCGRNIGKVREYSFNVNSGAVESLELDSFGISIIPSSLVSTYALFVEDVLEVLPDTVIVHEAAASRIQRLTKGFWGAAKKNMGDLVDEFEEYSDDGQSRKRNFSSGKFPQELVEPCDDRWELPMDYS
ncbi:hypothetical protein ACH5RR_005115 [Cinchona calisaya]|uniref:PRC-barrel domain-containing protein n=1 Tax=Cinchona calisaya TaxID=153742 RepID=A0ABD3AKA8_9GENT